MGRNYSSIATEKTLTEDVTNVATLITLNNITNLPSPPYTLVINPDTNLEEIVTVVTDQSGISAPQLRVARAQDGTTAQVHTNGNIVKHMITARDLQEAQDHISANENVHGISDSASLVYKNASQTLTNKTMSGANNIFSNIPQSAITNLVSDLADTSTALSTHSADSTDVHGISNSANLVYLDSTQILTNKRLTSPKINEDVILTASATELNILDGATLSTAELNYVDGVTSAIQTQLDSKIDKTYTVIAAKTSAYTIVNGDQNDLIELNGTFTVSIPTDATYNFPIGTTIDFLNIGTGVITFAAVTPATTTVNGTPGVKTRAQWSAATIIKRAANNWVVIGDLTA